MDKKQILKTVASNLKVLLHNTQFSSSELARRSGVSAGSISKVMKGSMSITIPMAMHIADGLGVGLDELLEGLTKNKIKKYKAHTADRSMDPISVGIFSIRNRRLTCVKDQNGNILGTSDLVRGIDLAGASGNLMGLIHESILEAVPTIGEEVFSRLQQSTLYLVAQSYEFPETRDRFTFFSKKYFKEVILLSDWQLTYLASFYQREHGISLVVDRGVALSYLYDGQLQKLGGWKFPVYDLGGENWLGLEAIRHTVEAAEGYVPMSDLAELILSQFNGKLGRITEACFKKTNFDIYASFAVFLLRAYMAGDLIAKSILDEGFQRITRSVERVDQLFGKRLNIVLSGSLADVYRPYFHPERLAPGINDGAKISLLVDLKKELLTQYGVL